MPETLGFSDQTATDSQLPVPVEATRELGRQPRSPEENIKTIVSTTSSLYNRIQALPDDLPGDPHNILSTGNFGGRGLFVDLRRTVVMLQYGQPVTVEHSYEVQVRSANPDPNKPFTPDDPLRINLTAENSGIKSYLQFRMAGSMQRPGLEPTLRGKNDLAEMTQAQVQDGVDGILTELGNAVSERERLAESLRATQQA